MTTSDKAARLIGRTAVGQKKHLSGLVSTRSGRPGGIVTEEALYGPERPMERLKEIDCSDCMVCGACASEPAIRWHAGHRWLVKGRVKPCPGWADKTSEDGCKCVVM